MTRLFHEKMLMDKFPDLQWIRVCTSAPFTATVYACDENLDLTPKAVSDLKNFLLEQGMATSVYDIKHYFELQDANLFPVGQIPERVKLVALRGDVTRRGVQNALRAAFPFVDPEHFDVNKDVITFYTITDSKWTPRQIQFVEALLSEVAPVGTMAKLCVVRFNP